MDWSNYKPTLHREEFGRLLRSPLKMKGHVTMDLCHPSGSLIRNTVSRGNLLQVPSLYIALRKTSWGGLFPCLMEQEERSALALKAKGNRGAVGEGRRVSRLMAEEGVEGEDSHDENELEEDVYGLEELRSEGKAGGVRSRRLSRSEREAEALEQLKRNEEEADSDEDEKNKKRKSKKKAVRVLIPGSPEAEAFEQKMLLRKRNEFTGRPIDKDTWYPEVESTNMRKMDRRSMARYTRQMPEYADGVKYEDVKALEEKNQSGRRGRSSTAGLGSMVSRLKQRRQQSKTSDAE